MHPPPTFRSTDAPAAKRPGTPRVVLLTLWGLLVFVAVAPLESRFHGVDTALAVASGLLIGATVNTFVAWKAKRESLVWAIMAVVALLWIIALRVIELK